MKNFVYFIGVLFIIMSVSSCEKKSTGFNLFTVKDDIEFGEQMDSTIKANPAEFPILDPSKNPSAYTFMNNMMQEILQSDDFVHKDDFDWEITIIDKDVMNAFAVPGGKMYFYTGIMKYLDNSAQLAGVLAHEMAHIDQRHSTEQMTKTYGLQIVLDLLVGKDKSKYTEIATDLATGLGSLQFSRKHEYEADEYSVRFMADTKYNPKGISGFFEKLQDEGGTSDSFVFLSTHPSDQDRIDNINEVYANLGSPSGNDYETEYADFVSKLP